MILPDVNILIYAFDEDSPHHINYSRWLETTANSDSPFGLADLVLSRFLRIVTHPKILNPPAPMEKVLAFTQLLRDRPNCVIVGPGKRHWAIFTSLCQRIQASGNDIPDAYLAALAIESGCEWVTADKGFARFPGLTWRHPLNN